MLNKTFDSYPALLVFRSKIFSLKLSANNGIKQMVFGVIWSLLKGKRDNYNFTNESNTQSIHKEFNKNMY